VPYFDRAAGARVEPAEANAVKLETFIFDALKEAESPIVLRTDRVEEFAPIKNAEGEDSAATSKAHSERARGALAACGGRCGADARGWQAGLHA
jgi:UDP-N-acetylglucosamine/UDP-N-acetylgalactosamine diphosphorylase